MKRTFFLLSFFFLAIPLHAQRPEGFDLPWLHNPEFQCEQEDEGWEEVLQDRTYQYFHRKLPVVKVCWNAHLLENGLGAATVHLDDGSYMILLDNQYQPLVCETMMKLYHESVHIILNETWGDEDGQHGERFQQMMLSLANEGAFKEIW